MNLKWKKQDVTTPAGIEANNHMVETLWRWVHAGMVAETEKNESIPQLIDTPKRVLKCECGNDDLHEFGLYCFGMDRYSLLSYLPDGNISAEHSDSGLELPDEISERAGLRHTRINENGEKQASDLWLLVCHRCGKKEFISYWDKREFIEHY